MDAFFFLKNLVFGGILNICKTSPKINLKGSQG